MNSWLIPVYSISLAFIALLGILSRHNLILAYMALIPWFGVLVDVGINISLERFTALFLLIALLAHRPNGHGITALLLLAGYAITLTVIQSTFSLPDLVNEYPAHRGRLRWALQLVSWLLFIVPGLVVARQPSLVSGRRLFRALVFSTSILALLGILQFFVYLVSGIDLFPMDLLAPNNALRQGTIGAPDAFQSSTLLRACALGGEPKQFAYSLAISLTVLLLDAVGERPLEFPRRRLLLLIIVHLAALFLTFSTQGYFLLLTNAVAIIGALVLLRRTPRRSTLVGLALATLVGILVIAVIPGGLEILRARTTSRLETTGGLDDTNSIVLAWLSDNPQEIPLGVGLGNVHLHARPYVPAEDMYYLRSAAFVAKSGALRLISELGVVGLLLFAWWYLTPLLRALPRLRLSRDGLGPSMFVFSFVVFVDYLLSTDGPLYLFMGLGFGYLLIRKLETLSPGIQTQ